MSYFVPPCNYGMVEYDLSRSGHCHQLNFPFLERLNLKTVIYLSHDEPSQPFLNFLEDQGIMLIRPLSLDNGISETRPMSEAEVLFALQVMLSPQYYPLHVMCNFGRHRTGTIVGCLRKLQRWSLTAIFEEYRRYAGNKVRMLNEQIWYECHLWTARLGSDHVEVVQYYVPPRRAGRELDKSLQIFSDVLGVSDGNRVASWPEEEQEKPN